MNIYRKRESAIYFSKYAIFLEKFIIRNMIMRGRVSRESILLFGIANILHTIFHLIKL